MARLADDSAHCTYRWIIEGDQVLDGARLLGMDRALLVCEAGNVASATMTERQGGVLEDAGGAGHGAALRYWITIETAP